MKFNLDSARLPRHIAIIMDGNGRWATKRLLPRKAGHRAGVKTMHSIIDNVFDLKIPYLTLYAFSSENKSRPDDEVQALFSLMQEYFGEFLRDILSRNIKFCFLGDISYFPLELRNIILEAARESESMTAGTLNMALNYGGRDEILRAANLAVEGGKKISQEEFSDLLYTAKMPDPDLILRTGGEKRLSNFLLYQTAYSELFFSDTLWPDFTKAELYSILDEFSKRNRRFGKV